MGGRSGRGRAEVRIRRRDRDRRADGRRLDRLGRLDGRYLVVFRDTKHFIGSTVVGWVGPYESIKDGTGKGGYRIKLFPNYGTAYDCGYQGLRLTVNLKKGKNEIVLMTSPGSAGQWLCAAALE